MYIAGSVIYYIIIMVVWIDFFVVQRNLTPKKLNNINTKLLKQCHSIQTTTFVKCASRIFPIHSVLYNIILYVAKVVGLIYFFFDKAVYDCVKNNVII